MWGWQPQSEAARLTVPHDAIVSHYFVGHVFVHITYDSLHALRVSVLNPTWLPWDTQEE
jgi:hypothetical protein